MEYVSLIVDDADDLRFRFYGRLSPENLSLSSMTTQEMRLLNL